MSSQWLGHHHAQPLSAMHRMPAGFKLGSALALILGTVLAPSRWTGWYGAVLALLILTWALSGLPALFVVRRILALSPFVLAVALLNALQAGHPNLGIIVGVKSALCLLTIILVSNTTSLSEILRVLKSIRVPGLLITTAALMHRYLFVLSEEASRMRRARLSRTFTSARRARWETFATVVSQLFIRASERAERIYDAMCARGWK